MEEKKRAVAKKLITPMMKEWAPVSPKMSFNNASAADTAEADIEETVQEAVEEDSYEADAAEVESHLESADELSEAVEEEYVDEEFEESDEIEAPEVEASYEAPVEDEEPHSRVALSDNKSGLGMGWYVVHTYSGYENKVKRTDILRMRFLR